MVCYERVKERVDGGVRVRVEMEFSLATCESALYGGGSEGSTKRHISGCVVIVIAHLRDDAPISGFGVSLLHRSAVYGHGRCASISEAFHHGVCIDFRVGDSDTDLH